MTRHTTYAHDATHSASSRCTGPKGGKRGSPHWLKVRVMEPVLEGSKAWKVVLTALTNKVIAMYSSSDSVPVWSGSYALNSASKAGRSRLKPAPPPQLIRLRTAVPSHRTTCRGSNLPRLQIVEFCMQPTMRRLLESAHTSTYLHA